MPFRSMSASIPSPCRDRFFKLHDPCSLEFRSQQKGHKTKMTDNALECLRILGSRRSTEWSQNGHKMVTITLQKRNPYCNFLLFKILLLDFFDI
jgi:hypothetical protein